MNAKWHQIVLACPRCEKPPTILSLSSSATGEILADLCCVLCGLRLAWHSNMAKLITGAFNSDLQEEQALHNPRRPPLKNGWEARADEKFLRALKIDPNEPKQLEGGA